MRKVCLFLFLSLVNPVFMALSFFLTNYWGFLETVSTNTFRLSYELIPVYIAIDFFSSAALLGVIHYFLQKRNRFATSLALYNKSQLVFVVFAPFLFLLIFKGIEGNIAGFLIIPLFLLLSIICIPISIVSFFRKLQQQGEELSSPSGSLRKEFIGLSLAVIFSALISFWLQGPYTQLADVFAWREDTPQYLFQQVVASVRNKDGDAFLRYVDLDDVLYQATGDADEAEKLKEKILAGIQSGEFILAEDPGKPPLQFEGWALGGINSHRRGIGSFSQQIPVANIGFLYRPNNNTIKVPALFLLNGERYTFDVTVEKRDGTLKIVGISNIGTFLENKTKKEAELLQAEQKLISAKNKLGNLIDFQIKSFKPIDLPDDEFSGIHIAKYGHAVSIAYIGKIDVVGILSNKTDKNISGIELLGLFRDRKTNTFIGSSLFNVNIQKIEPFNAYQEKEITFSNTYNLALNNYLAHNDCEYLVFPVRIRFADGSSTTL